MKQKQAKHKLRECRAQGDLEIGEPVSANIETQVTDP